MKFKNLSITNKIGVIVTCLFFFDLISYVMVIINAKENQKEMKISFLISRNRFFSQRIPALAQACLSEQDDLRKEAKQKIIKTIHLFEKNTNTLLNGGYAPFIENEFNSEITKFPLPKASYKTKIAILNLKDFFSKYKTLISNIINTPYYIDNKKNSRLINFEREVLKKINKGIFVSKAQNVTNAYAYELNQKQKEYILILIIIAVLNFITIGLIYFIIKKFITKPLENVQLIIDEIATGDFNKTLSILSNDEIGKIAQSLNTLISNIQTASIFANHIGQNKLDEEFKILGKDDRLGISLLNMRDNLKIVAEKENKRNWINEGLAKFTEILRETDDIELFYNRVISNLIRYIGANQGYLYVVNEEDERENFMEIKAVFAYDKTRYTEEKIKIYYKQGLIGQAWFDKEPLFFTEIPSDYVNITSGIGEATPNCIFIIPLIVNEKVIGGLEIASFTILEDHIIEFITKIGETIAGSVSNVKTNEKTKQLLHISQQQTEEMRAQEEEMRQNMEELNATQHEMAKKEREMMKAIEKLKEELETKTNN